VIGIAPVMSESGTREQIDNDAPSDREFFMLAYQRLTLRCPALCAGCLTIERAE